MSDGIEVGADAYEAWASGYDLRTGQPKGTLKENGVRFYVKVTNVPKDRSIAAEAWDDVSAALDAAMDRAGAERGRWLAGNTFTRVRVDGVDRWGARRLGGGRDGPASHLPGR